MIIGIGTDLAGALKRLRSLPLEGMRAVVEVSLSDEYPMAQAFVVVWAALA